MSKKGERDLIERKRSSWLADKLGSDLDPRKDEKLR